jgi:hypothetical protein
MEYVLRCNAAISYLKTASAQFDAKLGFRALATVFEG